MKLGPLFSALVRFLALRALLELGAPAQSRTDPLPSWKQGWIVISMKDDWKQVFSFEQ